MLHRLGPPMTAGCSGSSSGPAHPSPSSATPTPRPTRSGCWSRSSSTPGWRSRSGGCAELHRQLLAVEASRARIVAAGYEERRRLERDLHDGAQQRLVSIGLVLRNTQFALGDSAEARAIDGAVEELRTAIAELRELAHGVRPAYLDEGLDVALRELAGRTPLPVTVHIGPERFPADIEATAYFVTCEALANAVKHAGATGIEIRIRSTADRLVLTVRDDGTGGAEPARGTGLRGLSDRLAAQGGRLHVDSRTGAGTTVTAELPCGS